MILHYRSTYRVPELPVTVRSDRIVYSLSQASIALYLHVHGDPRCPTTPVECKNGEGSVHRKKRRSMICIKESRTKQTGGVFRSSLVFHLVATLDTRTGRRNKSQRATQPIHAVLCTSTLPSSPEPPPPSLQRDMFSPKPQEQRQRNQGGDTKRFFPGGGNGNDARGKGHSDFGETALNLAFQETRRLPDVAGEDRVAWAAGVVRIDLTETGIRT